MGLVPLYYAWRNAGVGLDEPAPFCRFEQMADAAAGSALVGASAHRHRRRDRLAGTLRLANRAGASSFDARGNLRSRNGPEARRAGAHQYGVLFLMERKRSAAA